MWQQKAKVQWLGLGDRNTKYFHTKASERKKKNTILGLVDEEGNWRNSKEDIANIVVSYFEKMYTTSCPSREAEVIVTIPTRITEEMNQFLTKELTKEEVKKALKQMHPTKAPEPKGMSAIFFQKYWYIVGNDIICMVLNVLNSNMSMAKINRTNTTLVPKTKNATKMTEFRPISLCNVVYKLVSKVLANRLKTILPQIITENQSAFLHERLITDNVLVAFELMHYLDHKREGNDCFMAVKLDMSKAYDRVKWGFIEKVMERMGFHEKWINLIMSCITTVTYSVLINGVARGCIAPSRGLHKGDPISLYLFLLRTDGFFSLINNAARNNMLSGISICRGCPMVTHLFYADDSMLFCKASTQECRNLMAILDLYEAASRQKVNADKSSIFFSINTPLELKVEIMEVMGPMQDSKHNKYLGLPLII